MFVSDDVVWSFLGGFDLKKVLGQKGLYKELDQVEEGDNSQHS